MDTEVGIYKIQNLITGEIYIGQSRHIHKRWQKHAKTAYNPCDHSYDTPLYRAIRKYGIENFSFTVIQNCLCEELNAREIYWIKYYDSFFHGYNLTFGGEVGVGQKNSKEKIIGIIKDLENTSKTQKAIAAKWEISEEMVQGINTGRYWKHDREYPIRKPAEKKKYYCIDCGAEITRKATRCESCAQLNSRKIKNRPSREELKFLIRHKSFLQIGKDFNVTDNAVRRWCDAENLPRKKNDINKFTEEEWEKI